MGPQGTKASTRPDFSSTTRFVPSVASTVELNAHWQQYVKSKSGRTLTVTNPVDDSLVTDDVQVAGEADVDAAVAAARAAFDGPWKDFTGSQRAKCMLRFADLLEANADKICHLETIAMGQPKMVGKIFFNNHCHPGWRCRLLDHSERSRHGC